MSSPRNELKRKRDDPAVADLPPLKEQGGHDVTSTRGMAVPSQDMMAEMKAMMAQNSSQMAWMKNEMNSMKIQLNETEGRCHYLEARCGSLKRTLKVLVKSQKWEYSAPDIPDSHWTELGFDEGYIDKVDGFLSQLKRLTCELRGGKYGNNIQRFYLNGRGGNDDPTILRHDSLLLSHWTELADALHLCDGFDGSGTMGIESVELVPAALDMLAPALKTKKFRSFQLDGNSFVDVSDGINFAIQFAQDHPDLESFTWMHTPIGSMEDVNKLLGCINHHPSLSKVRLENCCSAGVNGYNILSSLLISNRNFKSIDLESNSIRTIGGTHLPDFLALNPPLQKLCLTDNHLDDNDAMLIATALKHNTNLQCLHLDMNEMTDLGFDAFKKAVFDSTSLNSVADSNHTCQIYGDFVCPTPDDDPQINKEEKICSLLSSRNEKGSNVYHLDLELGEDSLKLVPKVLEWVDNYSRSYERQMLKNYGDIPKNDYSMEDDPVELVQPLSIMYELLRSWKMPELYESNRMPM